MARPVRLVILDLDGLLIESEALVLEVARAVVAARGGALTAAVAAAATGRRPLDAWASVVDALQLDCSAQELLDASEPLLESRWGACAWCPGAARLLEHLRAAAGVRLALATSTPRATLAKKAATKPLLREAFEVVVCGDDAAVARGKPAPDIFLAAAAAAGVPPAECLVLEDAPAGVAAAAAAGMRVVAVPSIRCCADYASVEAAGAGAPSGVVASLPSLLEFRPEEYGLPPFADRLAGGAVPLAPPLRLRGAVVRGVGRGSAQLGIPTANLDPAALEAGALGGAVTGIYCGHASVGDSSEVYDMVMSIGFNPHFNRGADEFAAAQRTAEPWILHDFGSGAEFYGAELRLTVCGYLRAEAAFTSLEALVEQIHADAAAARAALAAPALVALRADAHLRPGGGADGVEGL
jgi:HAD superfamily hydrolase (TIGR01509 family)